MKRYLAVLLVAVIIAAASPVTASRKGLLNDPPTPPANLSTGDTQPATYIPVVVNFQRVGERLNIYYSGSQTFPAGIPFHIIHGWSFDSPEDQSDLIDFQLQVDGIYREPDFVEMKPGESRLWVFNFSAGMSGVHTFTGHWLQACHRVYDECANPDELVEKYNSMVEVTFIP